jgi:hypothetical protein
VNEIATSSLLICSSNRSLGKSTLWSNMRASLNRGRRSTVARSERGQMPKLGPSLQVPSQHATRSTDGSSQSPHSGTRSARRPVPRPAAGTASPKRSRQPPKLRRRIRGGESRFADASLHGIRRQSLSTKAGGRHGIWRGNRMDLLRFRDCRTEGLMDPRESREDDTGAATALTAGCGARS